MTQDQIIQMAREAGAFVNVSGGIFGMNHLEKFAASIRKATKEEDAKICDALADEENTTGRVFTEEGCRIAAHQIRASK